ncbi:DUF6973 domain-containing protein [Thermomonospora cellulosilytica]|uniref:DUF6973 domain-containing protein n=1 Tax=Thermomonospora cellulosilytica TaxID=1411118 RepID=A0A7W3MWI8_9ACTN|nr:hypothetical protein [Thermomonospora cellulosilytica]MBA9003204.1 hypothetical protein [Thermomonospora cellulosilytica]
MERLPLRKSEFVRHLMEAGVCATLGVRECYKIAEISIAASELAGRMNLTGVVPAKDKGNVRNAVRHFIWQAAITVELGAAAAKLVGDVHELGVDLSPSRNDRIDSRTDLSNNIVARRYALHHRGELALKSGNLAPGLTYPGPGRSVPMYLHLRDVGLMLYRRGQLR